MAIDLDSLLKRGREVTQKYIRFRGKETVRKQVDKITEELHEFTYAIGTESKMRQLDEGWDIILAVMTAFHVMECSDDDIKKAGLRCLEKVEKKCNEKCKLHF